MLRKILSLVSNYNPSFIEIYDNALTKKECEILISQFNKSPQCEGVVGSSSSGRVVNKESKQSIELSDLSLWDGSTISNIILSSLYKCINKYKEKYSSLEDIYSWKVDDLYTFKKFESKDDGYKRWHTEQSGPRHAKRIAVWMFYLNNARSGTELKNFYPMESKMGRCIIWPASWTHVHRSSVPNKGLKYIVSGWISYNE